MRHVKTSEDFQLRQTSTPNLVLLLNRCLLLVVFCCKLF